MSSSSQSDDLNVNQADKVHFLTVKKVHQERLNSLKKSGCSIPDSDIDELFDKYNAFVTQFLSFMAVKDFASQCEVLAEYLDFAKRMEALYPKIIGHRSKYYSSILEEVPVLMSEEFIKAHLSKLKTKNPKQFLLGAGECVIRVAAGLNCEFSYETKRIDFCFALKNMDNQWIPLIGLEAKKYLDKTMMATVLETYKALKSFRARTFYGVLVEDEARTQQTIENSEMFMSEFVLTDTQRSRVLSRNVLDVEKFMYFHEKLRREIWYAFQAISS